MTPLKICGFILMSVLTIFFLLLIAIAMVRVLRTPVNKYEECDQDNILVVDILVTDKIPISTKDIFINQHILLVSGMTVLVTQHTDEDGLYIVDVDKDLIRLDCIKPSISYQITSGIHKGLIFQPHESKLMQNLVVRHCLTQNGVIEINEHVAQLILFIQGKTDEIALQFKDINCTMQVINCTDHIVKLVSMYQKAHLNIPSGSNSFYINQNIIALV